MFIAMEKIESEMRNGEKESESFEMTRIHFEEQAQIFRKMAELLAYFLHDAHYNIQPIFEAATSKENMTECFFSEYRAAPRDFNAE